MISRKCKQPRSPFPPIGNGSLIQFSSGVLNKPMFPPVISRTTVCRVASSLEGVALCTMKVNSSSKMAACNDYFWVFVLLLQIGVWFTDFFIYPFFKLGTLSAVIRIHAGGWRGAVLVSSFQVSEPTYFWSKCFKTVQNSVRKPEQKLFHSMLVETKLIKLL